MDRLFNTIMDIAKFTDLSFYAGITCPVCGFEIALWSDEEETKCRFCGYKIFHKERIIH